MKIVAYRSLGFQPLGLGLADNRTNADLDEFRGGFHLLY
jgi:hypothetical protein